MGSGPSLLHREDIHVVIVGGGYAGIQLAKSLKNKARFTLIDPKEMLYHNVGAVRSCTEPGFVKKIMIPYAPTFGENFKQGTVTAINAAEKTVLLSSGETVKYSHLVLATGSTGHFPWSLPDGMTTAAAVVEKSEEVLKQVKAANKIVIIGGGAVGTEIAAEITTDYKDKEVTLIHNRKILVDGESSDAFQKRLKEILEMLGVKLVLGERVTNLAELPTNRVETATVMTDKGTEISADLVIPCTGLKVNSMAYKDSLAFSMEDNGSLKVNNFFEVQETEGIYAIGDCTNIPETKMTYRAGMHAELLAKNILAQETGGIKKEYKPDPFIMTLSLGRKAGMGQKGSSLLPEFMVRMLKSRDMMAWKVWRDMGQSAPS
ncbi:ferroptosis suppressor protein 1-like [Branchiostoma floridae]|uniref:Ferroptosis suppressor protein 1 n=1 Tax=Branchiostoma floridae TaxID=7739 RepID=A0A9J7M3M4_BRAFL|nr:ferroptosis suppressor protein 1-like [Branchiostoma floridae]